MNISFLEQIKRRRDIRLYRPVGEHHPFGLPACTGGVDEAACLIRVNGGKMILQIGERFGIGKQIIPEKDIHRLCICPEIIRRSVHGDDGINICSGGGSDNVLRQHTF